MRMNHKMMAVAAVLAVSMMMTACGGAASSTASSAAESVASSAASSTAASEPASHTGDVLPIETVNQDSLDEVKTGAYKMAANITGVADGQLTMTVYSYDTYEKDAIDNLKEGDVIQVHDQGDQTVTQMTVESVENNADNGYVTINGGIEEGGLDLVLDHDVYRTMTFDDYPVYYEAGELTLPLAGDVTLSDSSADPQAVAVETNGAEAVAEAVQAEPDGWTCNNTTVFTQDGKVSSIVRIWVP